MDIASGQAKNVTSTFHVLQFVLVIVKEQHMETSNWRESAVNPGTRIVGEIRKSFLVYDWSTQQS
jgi:hypothetical protein